MHADPDCVGATPLLSIIHLDWIVEVKFDTVFRDRIFIVVTTCVIVIEIFKPATFDDRICPCFDCILLVETVHYYFGIVGVFYGIKMVIHSPQHGDDVVPFRAGYGIHYYRNAINGVAVVWIS